LSAASQTQQQGTTRAARAARAAALILAGAIIATLVVLGLRPPIGVRGQYVYPYRTAPAWSAALALGACAGAVVCAVAWAVSARRRPGRRGRSVALAVIVAAGLGFHLGGALLPRAYPGAELLWPFLWVNTEGAYAHEAGKVDSAGRFVSDYVHWLDVSRVPGAPRWVQVHHVQVHPPGPILSFVALDRLFAGAPRLAASVNGFVRTAFPSALVIERSKRSLPLRRPIAVAFTMALLAIGLAALAPLACYFAASEILPRRAALAAAGLAALVPGTCLFNPSFDQAFPTLTFLLGAVAVRAVKRRSGAWGVGTGVVLYALMFFHVGFGLAGAILAFALLVAARAGEARPSARELLARLRWPGVGVAVGFLTPAFLLAVWLGYPTFRVMLLCLRNNGYFNAASGRTYWPWVVVNPLEYSVSLGFALAGLAAWAWAREVWRAARSRSLKGASAALLAAVTVLLGLNFLGLNRGETSRLWLFLSPFFVVGAVDWVWRRLAEPGRLAWRLCAVQAVQAVLLGVALDMGHTATFMVELLGR